MAASGCGAGERRQIRKVTGSDAHHFGFRRRSVQFQLESRRPHFDEVQTQILCTGNPETEPAVVALLLIAGKLLLPGEPRR